MKLVYCLPVVLLISFVSAEITFFEENDPEFIMRGQTNENTTAVYCGNAVCDINETCENCVRDCGVCESGYFVEEEDSVDIEKIEISSGEENISVKEIEGINDVKVKWVAGILTGILLSILFFILIKIKSKKR